MSTAVQCGNMRCPTDNLTLSSPVRIAIQHTEMAKVKMSSWKVFDFIMNGLFNPKGKAG